MTVRILHVLDHSIPMQSGYTFRTRAILREQRRMGWETFHLTSPKHAAPGAPGLPPVCDRVLLGMTLTIIADDLTGASRFLCSAVSVGRCDDGGCEDDSPDGANIPQFVTVDLNAKLLSTTPSSGENRSTAIESLRREGGLIVLQGLQNGRAFSFVIGEKTGRASIAIAREELVLSVFAACTPMPMSQK